MSDDSAEKNAASTDAYASYLAEVDKKKGVRAEEDILNAAGALVVPKGTRVNHEVAQKVVRHKLLKPLEESISIEDSMTGDLVHKDLQYLLSSHNDLSRLQRHLGHDEKLWGYSQVIDQFPLIKQKLTVLKMEFPQEYQQACFTAWLNVAILHKQNEANDEFAQNAFISGLVHDLGLLHISPEVVKVEGNYTPEQWRAMQAHVAIGKLFLGNLSDFPASIATATLQHHERGDGTGYPKGKFAESIEPLAKLMGLSDSVFNIRLARPADAGDICLKDVLPILKFNESVFAENDFRALASLLKEVEMTRDPMVDKADMPAFIAGLEDQYHGLIAQYEVVYCVQLSLPKNITDANLRRANIIGEQLWTAIQGSGILSIGVMRWIRHVRTLQLEAGYAEMEEIGVLYEELTWQMQLFYKYCYLFVKEPHPSLKPLAEHIASFVGRLKSIQQQPEAAIKKVRESGHDINDAVALIKAKKRGLRNSA